MRVELEERIHGHTFPCEVEVASDDSQYELIEVTLESSRAAHHINVVLDSNSGQRMKVELFKVDKPVRRMTVEIDVLEEIIHEKLFNLNIGKDTVNEITEKVLLLLEPISVKI